MHWVYKYVRSLCLSTPRQHTYVCLFRRIKIAPERMHSNIKAACSKGVDNGASPGIYEILPILADAQTCEQRFFRYFSEHWV